MSKKDTPPPVVVGYKYFAGMHMILCHAVDKFRAIYADDRLAWSGEVTTTQEIYINAPELFGGTSKQGGLQGYADILMGNDAQAPNAYLQQLHGTISYSVIPVYGTPEWDAWVAGNFSETTLVTGTVPAYRGLCSVVLKQIYMGALNPYFKPLSFLVTSIPAKTWYPETSDINNGSANPIHIIYETWTNKNWGMGNPISQIDDTSFRAAALTCYNEGLGLSILLDGQTTMDRFIYSILSHCNGMLYLMPTENKIGIKLLRYDYSVNALPLFDENNIIAFNSYEVVSPSEIVNEIVVKYRPRGTFNDDTVTVHNGASILEQGANISETVSYPGIDTVENATRIGQRDLQQKNSALSKIVITVNRTGWDVAIGSVFRLSWAKFKINSLVFRVFKIDVGGLNSSQLTITAALDIFGLPFASYGIPNDPNDVPEIYYGVPAPSYVEGQPSLWVNPIQAPVELTPIVLKDANYYQISKRAGSIVIGQTDNSSAFILTSVAEPVQFMSKAEVWSSPTPSNYTFLNSGNGTAHCKINQNIDESETVIPIKTKSKSFNSVRLGSYAYIEDEIVRIDSISTPGFITVGRGCLHTVPKPHLLNSYVIFAEDTELLSYSEHIVGEEINIKALMRTPTALYDISSAANHEHIFKSTFGSPYPPGNVKINDETYPSNVQGDLIVTWSHRDRILQTVNPIADTTYGNIGPEPGTTYTLKLYNGLILLQTISGITGTSGIFAGEPCTKITLNSERDGFESVQQHELNFVWTPISPSLDFSQTINSQYLAVV